MRFKRSAPAPGKCRPQPRNKNPAVFRKHLSNPPNTPAGALRACRPVQPIWLQAGRDLADEIRISRIGYGMPGTVPSARQRLLTGPGRRGLETPPPQQATVASGDNAFEGQEQQCNKDERQERTKGPGDDKGNG